MDEPDKNISSITQLHQDSTQTFLVLPLEHMNNSHWLMIEFAVDQKCCWQTNANIWQEFAPRVSDSERVVYIPMGRK